jgi:hypothetical protein
LAFACALLALLGCESVGTSTGNPAPGDGIPDGGPLQDNDADTDEGGLTGNEGGGYCEAGESTELAVDEDSALGFSGADILAFAAGTHEETIRWNPQMNATLQPETGEGMVTITVTHDGGDVRYVLPREDNGAVAAQHGSGGESGDPDHGEVRGSGIRDQGTPSL